MSTVDPAHETSDIFDRFALRLESRVSHYAGHRDKIYRPVLLCSMVLNGLSLARIAYWTPDASLGHFSSSAADFILMTFGVLIAAIIFAWLASRKITQKKKTGLSLFVVWLLLELSRGGFLMLVCGLYAILNSQFRVEADRWAPEWYRRLLKND